ncbi:MAG: DUF3343 domain-containing protein [Christensenellales bacterium]|jgi:hypothetical protein
MFRQEKFAIAAFRSRSSVQKFEMTLRRSKIPCQIIATPRDVAIGCGLSVSFEAGRLYDAIKEYKRTYPSNLIGFYIVERNGGRTSVSPVSLSR